MQKNVESFHLVISEHPIICDISRLLPVPSTFVFAIIAHELVVCVEISIQCKSPLRRHLFSPPCHFVSRITEFWFTCNWRLSSALSVKIWIIWICIWIFAQHPIQHKPWFYIAQHPSHHSIRTFKCDVAKTGLGWKVLDEQNLSITMHCSRSAFGNRRIEGHLLINEQ